MVDEVEPQLRELPQAWPTMPATVIAERLDWLYSIRHLRLVFAKLGFSSRFEGLCVGPAP